MKLAVLLFLASIPSIAQSVFPVSGFCEQGGAGVVVNSSVTSTGTVQGSYPSCVVTVYNSGTFGLATIYNSSGTPISNPLTADTYGFWSFYANTGFYDVQRSGGGNGGIPNTYTTTFMIGNVGYGTPPSGTSNPATCTVGQLFFNLSQSAGRNLYGCTSTNTWTLLTGSGTVTSVGMSMPTSLFSGCNITITGSGTFSCSYATGQAANKVLVSNASGTVGFGTLLEAMLPSTVALTDSGNTYTSGVQNFHNTTGLILPGITTSTDGGYDYVPYNYQGQIAGYPVNFAVSLSSYTPTTGNCLKWVYSSIGNTIGDAGAPCGSITSFNTRTGPAITLTSGDVTTALGFTPPSLSSTNTYSAASNNDFSSTGEFRLPVNTGGTINSGDISFNTTYQQYLVKNSTVNLALAYTLVNPTITSGHCATFALLAGSYYLADAGAACGSGGGSYTFNPPLSLASTTVSLTYGPSGGLGTVSGGADIETTVVPCLSCANTFTGAQTFQQMRLSATLYSALPVACSGSTPGLMAFITDSTSQTWGATVSSGTGSPTTPAGLMCDGTNWTVFAK